MLFSLVVAVFFLPYHFLIQVDSQSRNVTENFQGLLDAVAHNENETRAKFVGELRKSERRLEEAFDTLKDEIQSSLSHHHRKHRHEIISAEHNVTTMKREAVVNVFDRAIFDERLNQHLAAYTTDAEKISYLTRELAHAEKEISRLRGLVNIINEQKRVIAIPLEVLQMRDAMEKRIDGLYGATGKPAGKTYIAALEDALTSKQYRITSNKRMMEFRSVVRETGFEDMDSFIEIVKNLYRDFSFGQAHKITRITIKLPSHEDEKRIKKILESAGVCLDEPQINPYIKAIQAFLKPLEEMGIKAPGVNERCVIFKTTFDRHTEEFKPEAKISKEDILHAFPEIKPLRAAWVSYTDNKQRKVYIIQVEFDTEKNAKDGCSNNHGWLKQFKVEPELSPCYNEDSKDVVIEEIVSRDDTVANPNSTD